MGEATPAHSAAGTFVPMLGVAGLGAMPHSTGPLHNAIVERLRARIELCRRHHNTCESRYQRNQAESSDREHESTLHLLNIVQQGPGNRKAKGGRGSNQQPPEYSRANGEQKVTEGDHKLSTRIALQGSLRRKIEAHAPEQASKQNGFSCGFSGSDIKRVRVEPGGLRHGTCNHNLNHSLQGASGMGMQRKNFMMPPDIFNMTLKEMKKEPIEVPSCGQSNTDIFDFKDEGGSQIDPDLQDLFDELTKTVPPLNDAEFEKMLKQDDAFDLDLGRPSSAGAAPSLCTTMDKPIKIEPSPDYGHVHCGSPQLRPASAGPSFTLTSTSSITTPQKANTQAGLHRNISCWPEMSHAEQLKQIAANQQTPSSLLHHHQNPPVGFTTWAPAMSTHSSTSTFPQDRVSNPGLLNQQRIGPPNKGINNCLFKSNSHNNSHHLDMKVLSTKPTLHFSPKAPPSASQPMAIMTSSATRTEQQQQQLPPPGQNQPHQALHFQNQQIPTSGNNPHDQFNRHLTRPPPEYKLSRSIVGFQQGNFLGPNPTGKSFGMNNVQRTSDIHSSGVSTQALGSLMTNVSMGWGPANKQVTTGLSVRRPLNPDMPNHPYQQRHVGPPNQVAPDMGLFSLNSTIRDTGPRPSQTIVGSPSAVGNLNQASPEQRVPAGHFAEPGSGVSSFQNNRVNRLTLDFLPEGDNTVPGLNADSDFIDSLLKSGSGNDDWMKDINLDEFLGVTHESTKN
uniref:Neurogenic mastermind-like N-terminal domain-containing protein n=1 Tax=Gouania willdenowi TaxID=441366 RepID=A0A8C5G929_GOUWI